MSDSDDGFEIDMGDSKPQKAEEVIKNIGQDKEEEKKDLNTKEEAKQPEKEQPKPMQTPKEENEDDGFEVSGFNPSTKAQNPSHQQTQPQVQQTQYTNLPTLPQNQESGIYSSSANCHLFGEESDGYHFLITGGYYYQIEQPDKEEEKAGAQPYYDHFYGTSRTFRGRVTETGGFEMKRYINMQKQRYLHCMVNCWHYAEGQPKNHIFAFGGQHNWNIHSSLEYLDLEAKKWIVKANMQTPRTMFSAVGFPYFIYVFGGFRDPQYYFSEPVFERYSIPDDTWHTISIEGVNFSAICGTVLNKSTDNKIIIFGGIDSKAPEGTQTLQSLHFYDPDQEQIYDLNPDGSNDPAQMYMGITGQAYQ